MPQSSPEAAGTPGVEYVETGSGDPVLFVPGSYSTASAWRAVQASLPGTRRFVATSLCGYGQTAETRTPDDLAIDHEVRVIETVAGRIGAPFHLVGHSFGGTIALAAALAGKLPVASIAVFEANPLHLIETSGAIGVAQATRAMNDRFEAACTAGDVDAAAIIIDFWGGDGAFRAFPQAVQDYCRGQVATNVLDWRTAWDFRAGPGDYARLNLPVLLVRGGNANEAMIHMTDALADCLPNPTVRIVDGAGHFLISTHAAACAALLKDFWEEGERVKS